MTKYSEFTIFPVGWKDEWAIVVKTEELIVPYSANAGGLSLYGKIVKVVHTQDKACRILRDYERKMGRPSF